MGDHGQYTCAEPQPPDVLALPILALQGFCLSGPSVRPVGQIGTLKVERVSGPHTVSRVGGIV